MKKLTILTALLFCIPLFAQDDPHIYWEFNTDPVDQEGYYEDQEDGVVEVRN